MSHGAGQGIPDPTTSSRAISGRIPGSELRNTRSAVWGDTLQLLGLSDGTARTIRAQHAFQKSPRRLNAPRATDLARAADEVQERLIGAVDGERELLARCMVILRSVQTNKSPSVLPELTGSTDTQRAKLDEWKSFGGNERAKFQVRECPPCVPDAATVLSSSSNGRHAHPLHEAAVPRSPRRDRELHRPKSYALSNWHPDRSVIAGSVGLDWDGTVVKDSEALHDRAHQELMAKRLGMEKMTHKVWAHFMGEPADSPFANREETGGCFFRSEPDVIARLLRRAYVLKTGDASVLIGKAEDWVKAPADHSLEIETQRRHETLKQQIRDAIAPYSREKTELMIQRIESHEWKLELVEGIREVIDLLQSTRVRWGVCTGSPLRLVSAMAKQLDIRVPVYVTADDLRVTDPEGQVRYIPGKPHYRCYQMLAERLNTDPSTMVAFEDQAKGAKAGRDAGTRNYDKRPVAFLCPYAPPGTPEGVEGARLVIGKAHDEIAKLERQIPTPEGMGLLGDVVVSDPETFSQGWKPFIPVLRRLLKRAGYEEMHHYS